jgi:hypothetical protein
MSSTIHPRGLKDIWSILRISSFFGLFNGFTDPKNPSILKAKRSCVYWLQFLGWYGLFWSLMSVSIFYLLVSSGPIDLGRYFKAYLWFCDSTFDCIAFYLPIILAEMSMIVIVFNLNDLSKSLPDYLTQLTSFYYAANEDLETGVQMAPDSGIKDHDKKHPLVTKALKYTIW